MHLGVLLESQQGSQSSSHVGACTSAFLPSCNSSVTLHIRICGFHSRLFHQPFSQGCPTCLRGWESILGVKVEAVQGKQDPLEWTEISGGSWNGGTTLEFLSPFLWRAPLLEMRRERRNSFPPRRERIPPLELGGGNGAPLDVGGTLVLPLEWRRICREPLELQQGFEGPFGSSRV